MRSYTIRVIKNPRISTTNRKHTLTDNSAILAAIGITHFTFHILAFNKCKNIGKILGMYTNTIDVFQKSFLLERHLYITYRANDICKEITFTELPHHQNVIKCGPAMTGVRKNIVFSLKE